MEDDEEEDGAALTVYITHVGAIRKVKDDCRRLQFLLNALHIRHHEVDIAENRWLRQKILQASGQDSLPLVFVADEFVGTYETLAEWNDEGVLLDRLRAKGYR